MLTISHAPLTQRLQKLCAQKWVSFAEFMTLALYDEHEGYYRGHKKIIGEPGDFITAPHLSTAFAHALFQTLIAQSKTLIPKDSKSPFSLHWVEPASEDGTLAIDLWRCWQDHPLSNVHLHYHAIEPHQQQRGIWQTHINALPTSSSWHWHQHANLNELPANFTGIVFANELFDALPCEVVEWDDGVWQGGVAWSEAQGFYQTRRRMQPHELLAQRSLMLPPQVGVEGWWSPSDYPKPYRHEINLTMEHWINEMMHRLRRGYALFFDYGDCAEKLYHPTRAQGTLKAIHHHRISETLWENIGEQDITAHVDFTAMATSAINAGGTLIGQTSQAAFLVHSGIHSWMETLPDDPFARAKMLAGFRQLIEPSVMGESIQVIAWAKGLAQDQLCRHGFST